MVDWQSESDLDSIRNSCDVLIHNSHGVDSTPYDIQIHTWEDDTEFVGQECYTIVSEAYQVSEIMRME